MPRPSAAALSFLLLLSACDAPPAPLMPDAGSAPDIDAGERLPPGAETTYYGDVRPILVQHCVMCHTEGGVAPFSLETYEIAVEVAERMREVTAARIMPPFLADASGDCQSFTNDRTLSDEDIATIGRWVEQGTPEGDPTTPAPPARELPALERVDATLEMPALYEIMTSIDDDYRCFVVDNPFTTDTFVTGYEVHPGNPERVHHVIVYNPSSDSAAALARDRDTGNGYPCFGGAGVDAAPMVLWAPGTGAVRFPRGTGVRLAAGRPQVVQVHYNNVVADDAPTDDRTTIDLMVSDSANEAYLVPLAHTGIVLPPRMSEVTQTTSMDLSSLPVPVRIWGSFPHMHTLGRRLRVELVEGDQCVLDVPRWDFNWQLAYWYRDPIRVQPGDTVSITCTYDTTERDETVRWGDGTLDEMCLTFFYVTI